MMFWWKLGGFVNGKRFVVVALLLPLGFKNLGLLGFMIVLKRFILFVHMYFIYINIDVYM